MTVPRVFLSHASEDKERFVFAFARALRAKGVDAWLDRWEMLPGDSLVDKIFAEGLASASAVIVVISENSVAKRWVAEELDVAVVKRIEEGSKLIPVVLDGLEPGQIPAPIRHLLFEPVRDPAHFEDALNRVVRAINDQPEKPPLGSGPKYSTQFFSSINGLDRIDSLILKLAGDEAVRDSGTLFSTTEFIATSMVDLEITEQQAIESLEVLDADGLVKIQRTLARGLDGMRHFSLTPSGLETYLRAYRIDYGSIEESLVARLANWPDSQGDERELTKMVGGPRIIVQHILDRLASAGLLRIIKTLDGNWRFHSVSPKLRRLSR